MALRSSGPDGSNPYIRYDPRYLQDQLKSDLVEHERDIDASVRADQTAAQIHEDYMEGWAFDLADRDAYHNFDYDPYWPLPPIPSEFINSQNSSLDSQNMDPDCYPLPDYREDEGPEEIYHARALIEDDLRCHERDAEADFHHKKEADAAMATDHENYMNDWAKSLAEHANDDTYLKQHNMYCFSCSQFVTHIPSIYLGLRNSGLCHCGKSQCHTCYLDGLSCGSNQCQRANIRALGPTALGRVRIGRDNRGQLYRFRSDA